jgi:predicted RNA polymerase sigma factor
VQGLVALLEIQASRMRARLDADGKPILLMAQDRGRWDQMLIGRGLAALARAQQLGGEPGPYQLQASIAACHALARTPEDTNWNRIVALYGELMGCTPSPVVALNRAVAVSMASGPAAALLLVDGLVTDGHLARYHLLHAARGDILARLDRHDEARAEFERAAAMTANEREKALLLERSRAAQR